MAVREAIRGERKSGLHLTRQAPAVSQPRDVPPRHELCQLIDALQGIEALQAVLPHQLLQLLSQGGHVERRCSARRLCAMLLACKQKQFRTQR